VKVRVDPTKCVAYGICVEHCPDVFKLDEFAYAHVEDDGLVPAGLVEAAERAVAGCPSGAITSEG
jgi:ferredoxin